MILKHYICLSRVVPFAKHKVEFIPSIILFNNGEEVYRIEAGISLQLPEDTIEQINNKIETIIESKF